MLLVAASVSGYGLRIDWIRICAQAATSSGMVRFFKQSAGAYFLIGEISVTAATPSSTTPAFVADWYPAVPTFAQPSPFTLAAGESLYVATENAEPFSVTAFGWNL